MGVLADLEEVHFLRTRGARFMLVAGILAMCVGCVQIALAIASFTAPADDAHALHAGASNGATVLLTGVLAIIMRAEISHMRVKTITEYGEELGIGNAVLLGLVTLAQIGGLAVTVYESGVGLAGVGSIGTVPIVLYVLQLLFCVAGAFAWSLFVLPPVVYYVRKHGCCVRCRSRTRNCCKYNRL